VIGTNGPKTESDPEKAAKFRAHGDRCEMLARAAHRRWVEVEEAKKAKRQKRPRRKGS
jgi:hypothetical protein